MPSNFLQEKRQLLDIAREALEGSSGNFELAEDILTSRLSQARNYRPAIMRVAAQTLLSLVRTNIRAAIVAPPSNTAEPVRRTASRPDPELMEGRLRNAGREWLNFPLLGGRKRLGDAVYEDLDKSASYYFSQGSTMLTTGRWLNLIKNSMPDKSTQVRDVLTDEKLASLHTQASQAIA